MEMLDAVSGKLSSDNFGMKRRDSSLLSAEENQIVWIMAGENSQVLVATVAELYLTEPPDHGSWVKSCCGVLCFVKDYKRRSYFFQLYSLDQQWLIWEQEMYNHLQYNAPRPYLHTFEAQDSMAAFNFADVSEAALLREIVLQKLETKRIKKLERINSTRSLYTPQHTQVITQDSGSTLKRLHRQRYAQRNLQQEERVRRPCERKTITKVQIGYPIDFRHVSHGEWDPNRSLEQLNDPRIRSLFHKNALTASDTYDIFNGRIVKPAVNSDSRYTFLRTKSMPALHGVPEDYNIYEDGEDWSQYDYNDDDDISLQVPFESTRFRQHSLDESQLLGQFADDMNSTVAQMGNLSLQEYSEDCYKQQPRLDSIGEDSLSEDYDYQRPSDESRGSLTGDDAVFYEPPPDYDDYEKYDVDVYTVQQESAEKIYLDSTGSDVYARRHSSDYEPYENGVSTATNYSPDFRVHHDRMTENPERQETTAEEMFYNGHSQLQIIPSYGMNFLEVQSQYNYVNGSPQRSTQSAHRHQINGDGQHSPLLPHPVQQMVGHSSHRMRTSLSDTPTALLLPSAVPVCSGETVGTTPSAQSHQSQRLLTNYYSSRSYTASLPTRHLNRNLHKRNKSVDLECTEDGMYVDKVSSSYAFYADEVPQTAQRVAYKEGAKGHQLNHAVSVPNIQFMERESHRYGSPTRRNLPNIETCAPTRQTILSHQRSSSSADVERSKQTRKVTWAVDCGKGE